MIFGRFGAIFIETGPNLVISAYSRDILDERIENTELYRKRLLEV